MPYTYQINGYKPFYIQTPADLTAIDTRAQFGMVAKVNPYPALPNPKEPYSNDWLDEDGEDEYVAAMKYEPMEISVSFLVKAYETEVSSAAHVLRTQIDSFFSKVRTGEFSIYDSYSGLGWRKVRFAGYEEEEFLARKTWARTIFTVTFKINDPITRISLSNGSLVAE